MCNSATLWSERVLNSYWRELPLMISGKDWNSWSAWKYPHDEGSISAWEDSYSDVLTTRPTNKKQTVPVKVPANSGYLTPNIWFFFLSFFSTSLNLCDLLSTLNTENVECDLEERRADRTFVSFWWGALSSPSFIHHPIPIYHFWSICVSFMIIVKLLFFASCLPFFLMHLVFYLFFVFALCFLALFSLLCPIDRWFFLLLSITFLC